MPGGRKSFCTLMVLVVIVSTASFVSIAPASAQDAPPVRVRGRAPLPPGVRDLFGGNPDPALLPPLEPALAANPFLERLSLDVLEHDVRPALVLAGVDHAHDVGVAELGHGARLAPEALELIRVRGDLPVHQLDRDLALERLVERAVDGRHAA